MKILEKIRGKVRQNYLLPRLRNLEINVKIHKKKYLFLSVESLEEIRGKIRKNDSFAPIGAKSRENPC